MAVSYLIPFPSLPPFLQAIPRSLTHYASVPPAPSTSLPPLLLTGAVGVPVEEERVGGSVMTRLSGSVPASSQIETVIGKVCCH